MKVKELIALLQAQDQEAEVIRAVGIWGGAEDVTGIDVRDDIVNSETNQTGSYVIIE